MNEEYKNGLARGLEIAIQRLQCVVDEFQAKSQTEIWEEGKGSFMTAGNIIGAQACVAALQRMLDKEKAVKNEPPRE